jgi:hypothetical protein
MFLAAVLNACLQSAGHDEHPPAIERRPQDDTVAAQPLARAASASLIPFAPERQPEATRAARSIERLPGR